MIPAWVRPFVGLPFAELGRGPEAFDCWGLCRWALLQVLGLETPDYLDAYSDVGDEVAVPRAIRDGLAAEWIEVNNPEPFDLVILKVAGRLMHVGLMVNSTEFLHAPEGQLSCVERYTERAWSRRVLGFYRHVSRFSADCPRAPVLH